MKKLLLICALSVMISNTFAAQQRWQQARAAAARAGQRMKKAMPQSETLQAAVALVRGKKLTSRQKTLLRNTAITTAFLAAVAAITGVAASQVKSRLDESERARMIENMDQPDVDAIAAVYKISIPMDESPAGLLVRGAVVNGNPQVAQQFYDLVDRKVLQVAKRVAESKLQADPNRSDAPQFRQIIEELDQAIGQFNVQAYRRNIGLISDTISGNFARVKSRLCSLVGAPSKNAIAEAQASITRKTGYAYEQIKRILNNPACEQDSVPLLNEEVELPQ